MKGLFLYAVGLLVAGATFAQQASVPSAPLIQTSPPSRDFVAPAGKLEMKEGDTLVFLGDSITHQCLYTQYIEDYFYTRFPKTRVHFHNAGSAGDRVGDTFDRLEEDVASFKPQYVAVLLGMNDGNFTDKDQAALDVFQKDMGTLLDRLGTMGATPILLTPTMFDGLPNKLNSRAQEPRDSAYNTVLGTYAAWIKELAKQRMLNVADVYAPLNNATTDMRRAKSDWTMIPDGMHPTEPGHFLMAAAFVSDVAFHPPVSELIFSRRAGQLTASGGNGVLAELLDGETLSFTFTAQSLPWVVPAEAEEGKKLLKPGLRVNSERLTVRDLKPGNYELKIDGQAIDRWTEKELAAGIDLGDNPKTPQYQQALKVALLNVQRTAFGEHPLRVQWAPYKYRRALARKVVEKETPAQAEQKKKAYDTWYTGMQKEVADFVARSQEFEDEIYKANEPAPHRYELAAVPAEAAPVLERK